MEGIKMLWRIKCTYVQYCTGHCCSRIFFLQPCYGSELTRYFINLLIIEYLSFGTYAKVIIVNENERKLDGKKHCR